MKKNKTIKEAVSALKALFAATVSLTFSQFEDKDGNIYQYSVLEKGAEVFKAGSEGTEPAPDGEYKVDEFTTIIVKDSVIEEVITKEEVKEEVPAELEEVVVTEEDVDMKEFTETVLKAFEELKEKYSQLEAKVAEIEERITKVEDEVKEDIEAISEGFSKLSNSPASKSRIVKTDVEQFLDPNKGANISALQSAFSKIKK